MQTGINRNKKTFCIGKSSEPLQNVKNQPRRPLVRSSFVYFCQNFLNLSHEAVHLKPYRLQLDLFLPDNIVVASDGGVVQSGPVGLLGAGLLVCRLLRSCKQFDLKYSREYLQRI
jgi:hypothetical protein